MTNQLIKSSNQQPFHNPWSRYDSPAVSRKHGREYLEKLFVKLEKTAEPDGQNHKVCEAETISTRSLIPDGSTLVVFNIDSADFAKNLPRLSKEGIPNSQLSIEILSS